MTIAPSSLDPKNSTFPTSSGDGYELQMGRHSRSLAPLFIAFAAARAGGKALDVGCGTGNLAVELANNSAFTSIEAFDFSPAYIAYAKARGADPRINFQTADACVIPFADGTFDLTLSMLVLAFIPEPQRAVREMVRVTRPGGTVGACMWDLRGGVVFARMFWDAAAILDPKAVELRGKVLSRPISRQGGIAGEFRAAGLQNVEETALTIAMNFSDFEDFGPPPRGAKAGLRPMSRRSMPPKRTNSRARCDLPISTAARMVLVFISQVLGPHAVYDKDRAKLAQNGHLLPASVLGHSRPIQRGSSTG